MWWLQRADLANRSFATAFQLGTYPDSSCTWVTDDIKDSIQASKSSSKRTAPPAKNFLLREIKRPNKTPLRLPLKGLQNVEKKTKKKTEEGGFPVPLSWRSVTVGQEKEKSTKRNSQPSSEKVSEEKELSLEEKLRILKEQEGYVPRKEKYKSSQPDTTGFKVSKKEKNVTDWISRSLEVKPLIGRLEGRKRSFSPIGKRLNRKSQALCIWHEEASHSGGRRTKAVLLHSLLPSRSTTLNTIASETELCRPICHLMRVAVPFNFRTSPRISPEEQEHEIEKGGHVTARDKLADYSLLVESFRRQKDPSLQQEEARVLLCKGILHDNAQEYTKALESYQEYLELCIKAGDKEGEAMAYNFMGCSLQEEQDLLFANQQSTQWQNKVELSTMAAIQYEKAEEYHKTHAEIADLEGKFMAYTNLGLLYCRVGKWKEAAFSHQNALKCATLMESPEDQGVAVGNLGFMLLFREEWGIAKVCMTKYLKVCLALNDLRGQANAHYALGSIALQLGRAEEALEEFEAALKAARSVGHQHMEAVAKIMVGVAQGNVQYTNYKQREGSTS